MIASYRPGAVARLLSPGRCPTTGVSVAGSDTPKLTEACLFQRETAVPPRPLSERSGPLHDRGREDFQTTASCKPASSHTRFICIGRLWANERPLVWRVERGLFHRVRVGLWVGLGAFARFRWLRLTRLYGHDGKMSAKPGRSIKPSQTSASLRASGLAVCGCIHRPLRSSTIWTVVVEKQPGWLSSRGLMAHLQARGVVGGRKPSRRHGITRRRRRFEATPQIRAAHGIAPRQPLSGQGLCACR
jgi:hypothetical protein